MGAVHFWQAIIVELPHWSQALLFCIGLPTDMGFITCPLTHTCAVSYQLLVMPLPRRTDLAVVTSPVNSTGQIVAELASHSNRIISYIIVRMEYSLQLLQDFILVFLPLLVAMDPLAILPFLVPILSSLQPSRRVRLINIAAVTGLAIGLLFLGLGRAIFIALGITVSDFVIAGGLVLLVISLKELVSSSTGESLPAPNELMAVVPIGTPLLVGPATISLLIVLSGLFSVWLVVVAFLANMLLAWVVFSQAHHISRFLGQGGLQAFSKVAYLLLAAIAIQLIRRGLTEILQGTG